MPYGDGTGPEGKGPYTGRNGGNTPQGGYGRRYAPRNEQQNEQPVRPDVKAGELEQIVGTGRGPCGDGVPRGGGRGRGYASGGRGYSGRGRR